ncbi:cupredoxin domain-containing protein [Candidatus Peregrinibacteria bacterium]|nr:cupredoxin domain-containing protein [Candidatus Peregrinibacteria bacterium]
MKNPFSTNSDKNQEKVNDDTSVAAEKAAQNPDVATSTKVKVIAALLIVGFAAYVAYWVQEPTDLRADILSSTQESPAPSVPVTTESSQMVAMDMPLTSEVNEEVSNVVEVSINDFAFSPGLMEIDKGTTVKWTNNDTVPHTVTGEDFTSGTLNTGETYEHTFPEDGEFSYTCSFHPQMQGKVVVGVVVKAETVDPFVSDIVEPETVLPVSDSEEVLPMETSTTSEVMALDTLSPSALETPETEVEVMPVVTTNVSSKDLSDGELTVEEKSMETHNAASESDPKSLAKSGPEDILYVGMFIGILYFTRKKAFGFSK